MTFGTMAITHSEQVTVREAHEVRMSHVSILIDFHRIVRRNTALRCE